MKILTGRPLAPRLAVLDLDRESLRTIPLERNPECPACSDIY
jgi:hypothetical protein